MASDPYAKEFNQNHGLGSTQRMPMAQGLLSKVTSGRFWNQIFDRGLIMILVLAGLGLSFGLFFGRSANNNGVVGTTSKVGKQLNPFVSNETGGIGQLINGSAPATYAPPPNPGNETVTVTKRQG